MANKQVTFLPAVVVKACANDFLLSNEAAQLLRTTASAMNMTPSNLLNEIVKQRLDGGTRHKEEKDASG